MKKELPKTCTKEMYVHLSRWADDQLDLYSCDMSEHGQPCIGKVTVTFDVPQGVDPVEAQISSLEKQIEKAGEEYQQKIKPLRLHIKELQAITHQV